MLTSGCIYTSDLIPTQNSGATATPISLEDIHAQATASASIKYPEFSAEPVEDINPDPDFSSVDNQGTNPDQYFLDLRNLFFVSTIDNPVRVAETDHLPYHSISATSYDSSECDTTSQSGQVRTWVCNRVVGIVDNMPQLNPELKQLLLDFTHRIYVLPLEEINLMCGGTSNSSSMIYECLLPAHPDSPEGASTIGLVPSYEFASEKDHLYDATSSHLLFHKVLTGRETRIEFIATNGTAYVLRNNAGNVILYYPSGNLDSEGKTMYWKIYLHEAVATVGESFFDGFLAKQHGDEVPRVHSSLDLPDYASLAYLRDEAELALLNSSDPRAQSAQYFFDVLKNISEEDRVLYVNAWHEGNDARAYQILGSSIIPEGSEEEQLHAGISFLFKATVFDKLFYTLPGEVIASLPIFPSGFPQFLSSTVEIELGITIP